MGEEAENALALAENAEEPYDMNDTIKRARTLIESATTADHKTRDDAAGALAATAINAFPALLNVLEDALEPAYSMDGQPAWRSCCPTDPFDEPHTDKCLAAKALAVIQEAMK